MLPLNAVEKTVFTILASFSNIYESLYFDISFVKKISGAGKK